MSEATTRTTEPSLARIRSRCVSLSEGLASTSKVTSARVFEVLACCPPGPPDDEYCQRSSAVGMSSDLVTRIPAAPVGPAGSVALGLGAVFILQSVEKPARTVGEYCYAGLLMVDVAQLVERQVVILDVAGSSPVGHPMSALAEAFARLG